jgi:hypothetical protein
MKAKQDGTRRRLRLRANRLKGILRQYYSFESV